MSRRLLTGGLIGWRTLQRSQFHKVPILYTRRFNRSLSTCPVRQDNHIVRNDHHGHVPKRTHSCGELGLNHVDQRIVLCGWAQSSRSLSQDLLFLPIADAQGSTQLVCRSSADGPSSLRQQLLDLSPESVICVEGTVRRRPEGTVNNTMATGEVEVEVDKLYCLNTASSLPFTPRQGQIPNEEMRLHHRYVDLRRPQLQHNIRLRSKIAHAIRNYLVDHNFVEIETPMLFKSTPEGAREYIVPTRQRGAFYALPQSPQQHKQMLMASGFDRYFQIARCFRDEDLRADRQPEFTQIDMEMSFVTPEDIQAMVEGMVSVIWRTALDKSLEPSDFIHMSYTEAMSSYGSDKPDTRFDLKIRDITPYLSTVDPSASTIDCLVVKQGAVMSSRELKMMQKALESPELEYVKISNDTLMDTWPAKCPTLRSTTQTEQLNQHLGVEPGDLVLVHKRKRFLSGGNTLMGRVRLHVAEQLAAKGLLRLDADDHRFLWIESFPLFTPSEEEDNHRSWQSTHHPFTAPHPDDLPFLSTDPGRVRGQHYDLVLNGTEIGGGSIRIHSPYLQSQIFDRILQLTKNESSRFDHLMDALRSGCPPHGGIALGFDRLLAILCRADSIRDVIAFPKAAGGKDWVVHSPSPVTSSQLAEYGLQLVPLTGK